MYAPPGTILPAQCRLYADAISIDGLAHEDGKPVLGTVGDNGKPFGDSPRTTTERFAFGVADASGNEWHVITYRVYAISAGGSESSAAEVLVHVPRAQ